jgi:hypothetical protein
MRFFEAFGRPYVMENNDGFLIDINGDVSRQVYFDDAKEIQFHEFAWLVERQTQNDIMRSSEWFNRFFEVRIIFNYLAFKEFEKSKLESAK